MTTCRRMKQMTASEFRSWLEVCTKRFVYRRWTLICEANKDAVSFEFVEKNVMIADLVNATYGRIA